jgi:hypothetical protein
MMKGGMSLSVAMFCRYFGLSLVAEGGDSKLIV